MSYSKDQQKQNHESEYNSVDVPGTDNLNIKSHLNSSLELQGITMSEELIAKTLEAIKGKEPTKQQHKTAVWNKYTRIIAGAAAAVLVVAVGMNFIAGAGKFDVREKTSENVAMDGAYTESTALDTADSSTSSASLVENGKGEELSGASGDQDNVLSEDAQDRIINAEEDEQGYDGGETSEKQDSSSSAAGTMDRVGTEDALGSDQQSFLASITNSPTSDSSEKASAHGNVENPEEGFATMLGAPELTFEDVFPVQKDVVSAIKIVNLSDHSDITLTKKEDIQGFFEIMSQQQYITGTEASGTNHYSIEIASSLEDDIVITLGEVVTVNYPSADAIVNVSYQGTDAATVLKSMDAFYQK